jgi:hypothetical protein
MRHFAIYTLLFIIFAILTSCQKENLKQAETPLSVNQAEPSSSLMGSAWTVVNDTTSVTAGATVPASGVNYTGTTSDYLNFSSHGKLYWSINGQKDTFTYIISGDTLKFKFPYDNAQTNVVDSVYQPMYIISNLTNHTCTLFNRSTIFNINGGGGAELTTINLKK